MKNFNIAIIDESLCVGCTKCIQACPVDAIIGADQQMHTVIIDHCIGCELCVKPCPLDCIKIIPKNITHNSELSLDQNLDQNLNSETQKILTKSRIQARKIRLSQNSMNTSYLDPKTLLKNILQKNK